MTTIAKQYVTLTGTSNNFIAHLARPLVDVIKTDLVAASVSFEEGTSAPLYFVQSRNLGNGIRTPDDSKEFWRVVAQPLGGAVNLTRVDTYLEAARTIQDIDIVIVDASGYLLNTRSITLVIEVETIVKAPPSWLPPFDVPGARNR